jgi:hypothetical protein
VPSSWKVLLLVAVLAPGVSAGPGTVSPEHGTVAVKQPGSAWGDLDRDGDLDLVVMGKESTSEDGKAPNKLHINVNGVLNDRTADFAPDWDVPEKLVANGVPGDVFLFDVNNDGWLDVLTTAATAPGEEASGLPWIYINKCCSVGGCAATSCSTDRWLGVLFENDRVPDMLTGGKPAGER